MTTSFIAMGLAFLAVVGLVVGVGALSLLVGAVDFIFGGPRIDFLQTQKGENGFAFAFNWNSAKEPAKMNYIQLRLFDALGGNKQIIISLGIPDNYEFMDPELIKILKEKVPKLVG